MSYPSRTRTRNRLYLVGVLPALLMLLVSGRITLLLLEESSGLSAYGAEEYDAARSDFVANQVLNPFEPWIAHFDEGTARHRGEDLDGAVTAYEGALDEGVPPEWECKVRNNLALAHEGIGDAAVQTQGRVAAEEEWRTARKVLRDCVDVESGSVNENDDEDASESEVGDPTGEDDPADVDRDGTVTAQESALVIDERLAAKLEGRDPASAPPATDPPPPAESLEERERQLRERDRRALEQRRLQEQRREAREDSQEDAGSEAPPTPTW